MFKKAKSLGFFDKRKTQKNIEKAGDNVILRGDTLIETIKHYGIKLAINKLGDLLQKYYLDPKVQNNAKNHFEYLEKYNYGNCLNKFALDLVSQLYPNNNYELNKTDGLESFLNGLNFDFKHEGCNNFNTGINDEVKADVESKDLDKITDEMRLGDFNKVLQKINKSLIDKDYNEKIIISGEQEGGNNEREKLESIFKDFYKVFYSYKIFKGEIELDNGSPKNLFCYLILIDKIDSEVSRLKRKKSYETSEKQIQKLEDLYCDNFKRFDSLEDYVDKCGEGVLDKNSRFKYNEEINKQRKEIYDYYRNLKEIIKIKEKLHLLENVSGGAKEDGEPEAKPVKVDWAGNIRCNRSTELLRSTI